MKKVKIGLLEIVLTAIITAIATFICSYFLMNSQLKEEQNYWTDRFRVERQKEILDIKIKLYEEINSQILELLVLAKDRKLEEAKFMTYLKECKNKNEKFCSEFDKINYDVKIVNYHKLLYKNLSTMEFASLYFGKKVTLLFEEIGKEIELNYNSQNKEDNSSQFKHFEKNFETRKELEIKRVELLNEMIKEIGDISNKIYNQIN